MAISKDEFIKRCSWHNHPIDYTLTNYTRLKDDIHFLCDKHGLVKQNAARHLYTGCPRCNYMTLKQTLLNNWIRRSRDTLYFDSFKFYIVKISGNGELFYKYGITFMKIKERMRCLTSYYSYEIMIVYEGSNPRTIMQLELDFRDKVYGREYTPKKRFGGDGECFL